MKWLFGSIDGGTMTLNDNGIIAESEILKISSHFNDVEISNFVIMPNHVHLIVVIAATGAVNGAPTMTGATSGAPTLKGAVNGAPTLAGATSDVTTLAGATSGAPTMTGAVNGAPTLTIGNIVRGYKAGVSRLIGYSPWQRNYHDHVIRNQEDYNRIAEYIGNNPARWAEDRYYRMMKGATSDATTMTGAASGAPTKGFDT